MKINKQLKYAEFSYDEEHKTFTITEEDGNRVILDKVYAFAFMRFIVRISQRNWFRNKKVVDKVEDVMVELENNQMEDPKQMVMFKNEASEDK